MLTTWRQLFGVRLRDERFEYAAHGAFQNLVWFASVFADASFAAANVSLKHLDYEDVPEHNFGSLAPRSAIRAEVNIDLLHAGKSGHLQYVRC